MEDLIKQLKEKEKRLQDMKNNRSKSFCVDIHTSTSYMKSEMEIEENGR